MSPITFLVILALLATIGTMIGGSISMARGEAYDDKHWLQWMEARVILQAITVALILIAIIAW